MSALRPSIELLQRLIAHPSVSSKTNTTVSDDVANHLEALGFQIERSSYSDDNGVEKVNLVAHRAPDRKRPASSARANTNSNGVAYFCHTDVVPADNWTGPGGDPFRGVLDEDRIYGRGSCDMKGSLVAIMAAAERIAVSEQHSPIWIACTADEEVGFVGAKKLVRESSEYRSIVESQPLAIIGEPTHLNVVHAHKGIVGARVTSRGRAAHSSTTEGINANQAIVPLLQTLLEIDQRTQTEERYLDHRFDPPVLSWNFGVSDGCEAVNVTPGKSVAWISFRPMPGIDGEDLLAEVESRAKALGLEYQLFEGGAPLWIDAQAEAIRDLCAITGGEPSTVCYGTDGGEFNDLQHRVVLGPGDILQAHTTDEWLALEQLDRGIDLYEKVLRQWCVN